VPIPRIIHQVWVGPSPLPERFAAYQETWRRLHPDWELRFWTEDNLPPDLRRPEAYERLRSPVERCDILRLEVLWRDGGVYVDTDFEALRPIDELLGDLDFFVGYIGPGRPAHGLMGAVPRHPIIGRALEEIRPREHHGYDKEATGPPFFNAILADHPEVHVFPSTVFYPASEEERRGAYADHHAERSWQTAAELRRTLEKALVRLEKSEAKRAKLDAEIARLRAASRGGVPRRAARAAVRRLRAALSR
jgi:mannosyltransferase OCH1-like enzyme